METKTARGKVEGWYVELREGQKENRQPCLTCQILTYGRNEYGQPQDFTCYFETLTQANTRCLTP